VTCMQRLLTREAVCAQGGEATLVTAAQVHRLMVRTASLLDSAAAEVCECVCECVCVCMCV